MSTGIRPGMVRFSGHASVYFVALCHECDLAMPFATEHLRHGWMWDHATGTGHQIDVAVDVRLERRHPMVVVPEMLEQPAEWTPFNEDGHVDDERLKKEGWHFVGTLKEEDDTP